MSFKNIRRISVMTLLAGLLLAVWSCAPTQPLPQPRRVVDPSTSQHAVHTPRWDIAAVSYGYYGKGINYDEAGLDPVLLAFKNKSNQTPQIYLEEVRGVGNGGEYLVYSAEEAARLVYASESFSTRAGTIGKNSAIGAAAGAGLGALIGLLTGGNDMIWKGALIGTAAGGVTGAAASAPNAEGDLKNVVLQEMRQYSWQQAPLPPQYTRTGYLYFPNVGVYKVKVTVRTNKDISTYEVPVDMPPMGQPAY